MYFSTATFTAIIALSFLSPISAIPSSRLTSRDDIDNSGAGLPSTDPNDENYSNTVPMPSINATNPVACFGHKLGDKTTWAFAIYQPTFDFEAFKGNLSGACRVLIRPVNLGDQSYTQPIRGNEPDAPNKGTGASFNADGCNDDDVAQAIEKAANPQVQNVVCNSKWDWKMFGDNAMNFFSKCIGSDIII